MSVLRDDAVVPVGDVTAAAMAWRHRGVIRVTAIAKATFAFVPDAAMTRIPAQPIVQAEVHHRKHPGRSVRLSVDVVPYLHRADVLLTGYAHAPRGSAPTSMPVRLGVLDGADVVLDKTVIARKRGGITEVPLVYEQAYGGIGCADNPYGVGAGNDGNEPSLIDPRDEKRPAGFGPIGQALPSRKRRLGGLPRFALEGPGLVELPDAFDWEYFQSAPEDQRVGFLRGDEWIVMEGVHPEHLHLRTALPGARGFGLVYGLGPWGVAEGHPIAFHADTLRIDADAKQCSLTFRATFPVPSEAALPDVRVVLGVALPDQPVIWPDPALFLPVEIADAPESAAIPLSSEDIEIDGNLLEGTLELEGKPDERASAEAQAPRGEAPTALLDTSALLAGITPARGETSTALLDTGALLAGIKPRFSDTLASSPADDAPALPFTKSAPPAPPAPAPPPAARPYRPAGDTLTRFSDEERDRLRKPALPFGEASPRPAPASPPLPLPLPAPAPPPAPAPLRVSASPSPQAPATPGVMATWPTAQPASFGAAFLAAIASIEPPDARA